MDEKKLLGRYLYNCNNCIPDDMERAKMWFDKAFKIDPNDRRVMFLMGNFYKPVKPVSFSEEAYYWEGRILARQEIY